MSNKTPFEIRLDLLKMAQEYFIQTTDMQQKFAIEALETAVTAGKLTVEEYKTQMQSFIPKTYTVEDIVEKAKELYSFVSDSKTSAKK